MAKSQSELSLPGAFLLVNARHHSHCHCEEPKATKQCQYIRGGEEKNAWPGQNAVLNVVRGFNLVQEHKESTTLKGRTTARNDDPTVIARLTSSAEAIQ
jgi:hypothetical protein